MKKRNGSLVPELKKRVAELEKISRERFDKCLQLEREGDTNKTFITTVGALLGVSQNPRASADYNIRSANFDQSLTYHDVILKSLSDLKTAYAREDEGSKIESEKCSMIVMLFRAALHDPTAPIEEAAKVKFLEMLGDPKNIQPLMHIARSFGIYPPEGSGPEDFPIYKNGPRF